MEITAMPQFQLLAICFPEKTPRSQRLRVSQLFSDDSDDSPHRDDLPEDDLKSFWRFGLSLKDYHPGH